MCRLVAVREVIIWFVCCILSVTVISGVRNTVSGDINIELGVIRDNKQPHSQQQQQQNGGSLGPPLGERFNGSNSSSKSTDRTQRSRSLSLSEVSGASGSQNPLNM